MMLLLTRVINLVRIITSYLFSRIPGVAVHWGNPAAASIEPNNSCNLGCPECPAGMKELTRPRGFMQPEIFNTVISQLSPHLSYLTLYFQGEPYLSKHIFDFIAAARSKRIFVATSTNGHFLDETTVGQTIESGLNRLIISLDGADRQSYEAYRKGGDFDRVVAGIRLLVQEKKRLRKKNPEIILQCLVLRSNEHQLGEIRKLAKELGVDKIEFKTAQFNDYVNGNPLMPEKDKYSRYACIAEIKNQKSKIKNTNRNSKKPDQLTGNSPSSSNPRISKSRDSAILKTSRYRIKNSLRNSCFRMWSSCVVTWDGKVVPCCFDKDATHVMGDLNHQPFEEIWRGKPFDDFRKKILKNRKSIGICSNCSQNY
jgi:radical SAM protein with 4Fe4S-binding SPASM domain